MEHAASQRMATYSQPPMDNLEVHLNHYNPGLAFPAQQQQQHQAYQSVQQDYNQTFQQSPMQADYSEPASQLRAWSPFGQQPSPLELASNQLSELPSHEQPEALGSQLNEYLAAEQVSALIDALFARTQHTEKVVKESSDELEHFKLKYVERCKLKEYCDQYEQQAHSPMANSKLKLDALARLEAYTKQRLELEKEMKNCAHRLAQSRQEILPQQRAILNQIAVVQQAVLGQHLAQWQQDQQFSQADDDVLNRIQVWVEGLTEITWRLRNQVRGLYHTIISRSNIPVSAGLLDQLDHLGQSIDRSLEQLTLNTFVVEKQPPQVMKTNTRFSASVRFLAGTKLGVNLIRPTVRVIILSESKARSIIKRHHEVIAASWQHLDNQAGGMISPMQTGQPAVQQIINNQQADLSIGLTGHEIMAQGQINPSQLSPFQQQQPQQQLTQIPIIKTEQPQQQPPMRSSPSSYAPQQPFQQPHQYQPQPNLAQHLPYTHHQHHHQQQQLQLQQQQQLLPPPPTHQQHQAQLHRASPTHPAQTFAQKVLNLNEFEQSGEIVNNAHTLEYTEKQLIAHFRNMQLKKIKRAEKKGTESVMDEKFIMLFHTQIRIADSYNDDNSFLVTRPNSWINAHDLAFHIMAFSLPVVVIVHGNQEPHAWATVTWHNAFARPDDILYQVPHEVTWDELGQVLSYKFETCCRKPLSRQNLSYLASKVCRTRVDRDETLVTWAQFAKEPLPGKQFTFWEWFHSILKLTKEHLVRLWSAECIYGFTGKKSCIDLLLGSAEHEPAPSGTFLLRFSETALGGITIAWVSNSSTSVEDENIQILRQNSPTNSSGNILMHVKPFSSKDLLTRSLADRIKDLDDLVYLYPNIPKDNAFQMYYSKRNTEPPQDDYVEPELKQTLLKRPYKITPSSNLSPMECSMTFGEASGSDQSQLSTDVMLG